MSLNMNESTTLATTGQQKKQLKIAKPFEPPKLPLPEPIQNNKPYYPPQSNQPFYQNPQQQFPIQQQPYYGNPQTFQQYPTNQPGAYQVINQSYNHQQPLRDIQIDVAQVQQPQIIQPQTEKPKEKKKLKISTNNFEVQGKIQDKLQEVKEEQKKKEEQRLLEEQKKKEQEKLSKQPKPYSKEEIDRFLITFKAQDFTIFNEETWVTLANRKFREMKEFTFRGAGERKSTNTHQNNNNQRSKNRPNTEDKKPEPRKFDRGTDIAEDIEKPIVIRVGRQIEDNSVKFKREQLKAQTGWVNDVQTQDADVQILREIKFKLNQLAPDNFNSISKIIIEYLVNNHNLAEYIAQRIIEKSQLEPKYRFLYTKLCAYMVNDSRLQITAEQQANNEKQKKGSIFKTALLNGVQKIFENRIKNLKEDLTDMASEQKESYQIQRKNKIMGNVRFIGDLYLQKILPQLAVQVAIRELLQEFLSSYKPDSDNLEESLEGLIELLDQIGPQYKVQQPVDAKQKMQEFFNGKPIEGKQLDQFCSSQFNKFIPLDNLFQIFDLLKVNYKLSSRLSILYENLLDRRRNGWREIIHQKGESAKSAKQLQDEYEKEQDRSTPNNKSHGGRRQQQSQVRYEQVQYVQKDQQKNGKQYQEPQSPVQQQQPDVDLVELAQYVTLTFKSEGDEQADRLKDEIKRYSNNEKAQTVIFESFFTQMLKPSKSHVERSQIVYELLSLQESNTNSIKKGLTKVFSNEDYIYDLVEAPIGVDLFVDIIFYFVNENDLKNLEKLQIKPAIYVEDYYNFLARVMSELEEKFPETDIKKILNSYLQLINITEIIVE